MINIDTRPDLISLLMELNRYNCTSITENQILIEIPQFSHKLDPWYGLILVCKPNRTSIEVYVCKDKNNAKTDAYVGCFENFKTLGDLIDQVIEDMKTCDNCGNVVELNDLFIHNNKIICVNCHKNIRSKY